MVTKERLKEILKEIDLPEGQWGLGGSGILLLRDINPRPIGDIDIFCTTKAWFDIYDSSVIWSVFTPDPTDRIRCADPPYLYRDFEGIQAHIFYNWRIRAWGNFLVPERLEKLEWVDGIPCLDLDFMLTWKREAMREKDMGDIEAIEKYLGVSA